MRRREFISGLFGVAAAWPLAAQAHPPDMPVIGFLSSVSPEPFAPMVRAFRNGLKQIGYVEGKNVAIEYRWAQGNYDRLPALAADLVNRGVTVIAATGGPSSGRAAEAATSSIPIVFMSGADPVHAGLVSNFARPQGNATGITFFLDAMTAKRLGLIREIVPNAAIIGVLVNPKGADTPHELREVQAAARSVSQKLIIVNASTPNEIDKAFTTLAQQAADALVVGSDPMFTSQQKKIFALAISHRIPTIYGSPETTPPGALASYGPSLLEAYRLAGTYTGKILRGAKPADLPVLRPTQLRFMINLRVAKSLGLKVPPSILLRADQVIE